MKRKIFSVLLALVLVLSFSLMTAVPVAAQGAPVTLRTYGNGTAEWSTDYARTGSYSLKLFAPATTGDYGIVVMPLDMEFEELADFSVYVEGGATAQALPLHDIKAVVDNVAGVILPASNKGTGTGVDLQNKIVVLASQPGQSEGIYEDTLMSDGIAGWEQYGTHTDADIDVGTGAYWSIFVYSAGYVYEACYDYYTWDQIHSVLNGKATVEEVRVELRYPQNPADVDSTVYVDDITINTTTYDLEPRVINTTTPAGFSNIQDAIDAALAGDTILVADGIYEESISVTTANLTLRSVNGRDSTTIVNEGGTTSPEVSQSGFLIRGPAIDFTLGGAVDQGFTFSGGTAPRLIQLNNGPSGVELSYNTFDSSDTNGTISTGINIGAGGATGLTVDNNIFIADEDTYQDWPLTSGGPLTNLTVTDNEFTGSGTPGKYGAAIDLNQSNETTATLSGGTITNNTISGFDIGMLTGSGGALVENLDISQNDISGCGKGIMLRGTNVNMATMTVTENNIHDNTLYGIENTTSTVVTAESNWWGTVNGPAHEDNTFNVGSQGNAVSDNVDYCPWLDDEYDIGDSFSPVKIPARFLEFSSIGAAIDAAIAGDTITVAAGTYNEDITLKNGVEVLGAGEASTTINGTGTGSVVTASGAGSATKLDGFTITGGNTTTYGGGMYNLTSSPTVSNCTFSGNTAEQGGGGMCNSNYSSPTVTNCTFFDNSTHFGGAGMANYNSSPTITDCTFYNNTGNYVGGMSNDQSPAKVTNCTFYSNTGQDGGGMANTVSSPTVTNCIFYGNHASGRGGGMYNGESSPEVTNCTFSGNSATLHGGAIYSIYDNTATVTNCILWGDSSPDGPEIYDFILDHPSVTTVTYSDVQGGWPGAGNKNIYPRFADAAAGDYHLEFGSPCIDFGSNAAVPPAVTTDFEGDPRIIGAAVDMGADEFLPHEVWVDDDFTGTTPGWGLTHFAAIQPAIDAVAEAGTVNVAAGTYVENVNVDKSLTLTGASSATVTVGAAGEDNVFDVTASSVTISGFTVNGANVEIFPHPAVEGFEIAGYAGIYLKPGVTDCNIHDNTLTGNVYGILLLETENTVIPGNNTFTSNTATSNVISGIEMQHTYGNTFTSNIASSNGKYGITLDSSRNNTFTGNTANSNGREGFWLKQGQGVDGSSGNTFIDNTANLNTYSGVHMTNLCGDSTYTGNTFNDNVIAGMNLGGTAGDATSNLTVNNNTFSGNATGILIDTGAVITSVVLRNNNIVGNTDFGASNLGTGTLDAENNWWGDGTGPQNATTNPDGLGNAVSDNVDFDPWLYPPAPPPPPPPPPTIETNLFGIEASFETNSDGEIQETIVATSEDENVTITIEEGTIALDEEGEPLETLTAAVEPSPPEPPEDTYLIGAYGFGPAGASFDPPLTLTWSYDPETLPEDVDLVLAYYDEVNEEWVWVPCEVDTENNIITASVAHFTTFAIIAVPAELPPVVVPAAFIISSLGVSPSEVAPSEEVNISVLVANTGGESGNYTVVLKIDGVKESEERVTVAAGGSQTVTFSVTKEEAGSYTITVDGLSSSFAVVPVVVPPEPAAFSVSYLSISQLEVEPGELVTISVLVANTGGESGSYPVVLKIDGVKEAEKSVTVAPGESQDVSFSVTREEAGSYTVAVNGLSGSFTVVAPAKPGINWAMIGGIIGGVIVVGLLIFFVLRRRRAA